MKSESKDFLALWLNLNLKKLKSRFFPLKLILFCLSQSRFTDVPRWAHQEAAVADVSQQVQPLPRAVGSGVDPSGLPELQRMESSLPLASAPTAPRC